MDWDLIFAAGGTSFIIAILVFFAGAAIFYAIVKKKKDYNSTGIPKQIESNPKEKEGSTGNKQ